jgi:hypothetical protein
MVSGPAVSILGSPGHRGYPASGGARAVQHLNLQFPAYIIGFRQLADLIRTLP